MTAWEREEARDPFFEPDVGWIVTRHADVAAVFSDLRFAVPEAPPGNSGMAWLRANVSRFANGERHRQRRALVVAEITRLDRDVLATGARRLTADVLPRRGTFDVMSIARRVPMAVLCEGVLGKSTIADAAGDAIAVAAAYALSAPIDSVADEALARLLGACGVTEGGAACVGVLAQACDATAALIGNALLASRGLPEAQRAVPQLVAETLRFDPPAWSTRRVATETVELSGCQIDAGTTVVLHLRAANRDPAVFDGAAEFRLQRSARERHLAFGAGHRACPGSSFAVAIAEAVVSTILGRGAVTETRPDYERSPNLRIPTRVLVELDAELQQAAPARFRDEQPAVVRAPLEPSL
jgi:cytochrome P450